jgi:hypothetical protein
LNSLIYVLQRQSGQAEQGNYYLTEAAYATSAFYGYFVSSLSRVSVPVSVTIDTSITAPSNFSAPATDHLTANGFHVYASATGITPACNVAGLYTMAF